MTLEELENRLQVLEDDKAVRKLNANFLNALSTGRWDYALGLFMEDAITHIEPWGTCKGKKEIAELFNNNLAGRTLPAHGHLAVESMLKLGGNWSMAQWIVYLFFDDPEMKGIQGEYHCEYRRVDGVWKIRFMQVIRPWPPLAEMS